MGNFVPRGSGGVRRYNHFNAVVERHAREFEAIEPVSPTILVGKLKRAAPYLGIPPEIVALMDKLCSHSRKQDWKPGSTPIVWPSNEELMLALGRAKRTIQNHLRAAIEFGLIVPRDSPNGHRGGRRNEAGEIMWAYGFDLRPLGARAVDFDAAAARGLAEDKEIKRLRAIITASRRRARMLALAVDANGLSGIATAETLDFVRMAVSHVRGSRDIAQLVRCVAQVTECVDGFQRLVDAALDPAAGSSQPLENAPAGVVGCARYTTTNKLEPAKAVTSRSWAEGRSPKAATGAAPPSVVEADLERHGIDAAFVARACPEVVWDLELGPRAWGRLTSIAERLVDQHDIGSHAWREACRLMGQRGAAAAVIATMSKTFGHQVRNPGAYLRGMSQRASTGDLHLGKTYHGLRNAAPAPIQ